MIKLSEILSDYFKNEIEKNNTKYEFNKKLEFIEKLQGETLGENECEYIENCVLDFCEFVIKIIATCPNLKFIMNSDCNIDIKYNLPLLLGG